MACMKYLVVAYALPKRLSWAKITIGRSPSNWAAKKSDYVVFDLSHDIC